MYKVKFVSSPNGSGFLGFYPLNGKPEKQHELDLEPFPEDASLFKIEKQRLKVYRDDHTLGVNGARDLRGIKSRSLTLRAERAAYTTTYQYIWK